MKIWLDGKLVDRDEAKVSVFDHAILYGDGCFEGIRFYSGKVFRLQEHIERLFNGMRYLMIDLPWSFDEVCKATEETVAASGMSDGYIRLVVTRGVGDLGLNPRNCPAPSMFIIVEDIALYPKEMYENGLSLITSSYRRPDPDAICQQVKSLNYLNSISAKLEAVQQGAGEALMLNERGNVAECTGDNIFIVSKGVVMTPPLTESALGGITRHAVMDICAELGIPCEERVMNRYDVLSADECFLTGTAAEVIAVSSLDGRTIGTGHAGPVTMRILARYKELVRE
ncbi:MAG TPA: branched-chain-amino-acid transaminase [Candidatus Akkermansia intestinavium]|nr:branched-chain-amino-acid transaminase [Candidatus Akkermansia intestinavium]